MRREDTVVAGRISRDGLNTVRTSGNVGGQGKRRWGRRTARLIVEDTTEVVAVREDIGLMREVGAAGLDEIHAREV